MLRGLLVVLIGLGLFAGCEKSPKGLIGKANRALETAKKVDADYYSADHYARADSAYQQGMEQVLLQSEKKPMHRNYRNAKKNLRSAILFATVATRVAEMARDSGLSILSDQVTVVDSTLRVLRYAVERRNRLDSQTVPKWNAVLAAATNHLAGARQALAEHRAAEGIALAEIAASELSGLSADLKAWESGRVSPKRNSRTNS